MIEFHSIVAQPTGTPGEILVSFLVDDVLRNVLLTGQQALQEQLQSTDPEEYTSAEASAIALAEASL